MRRGLLRAGRCGDRQSRTLRLVASLLDDRRVEVRLRLRLFSLSLLLLDLNLVS